MIECTDTVTVVNKTENGYVSTVVNGVYWYGGKVVSLQGRGVAVSDEPTCIFPYSAINGFVLKAGDYVIKGEATGITSVKDVNKYSDVITIRTANEHLHGSKRIWHVTVR